MTDIAALSIRVDTLEAKVAATDLAKLEKAGAGAEKAVQGLSNVAAKLAATLAGLGIAAFVKESALLAARYETLGVVMLQAGKNAGYGSDQMRKFEKDLRSQGIAAIEARQNLAKMAAAQMDLAQAGQLARAAQDLAVVGDINSSEAFSRMTQGIQSGEVEVLRTIGLNVRWEDSYKRVAKEMGKNANALSVQEKLQARVGEVLLKASEYAGIYEESMKTAGKQISSFTRYWQDMQGDLGASELPAVTILVQEATKRIKEFTAYIQKDDTQKALAALGNTAVLTFDTIVKLGQQIGPLFVGVLDGYNRLPDIVKEVGLVGVILGGRQGKIVLASLTLFSSVASSLAKIRDAKQAYGSGGMAYFDRGELNKQAEFARSMEGIQARLARVRKEMAVMDSGAGGVSFYKRDNEARRLELKAMEASLIDELAGSSALTIMQARENDIRAAQSRISAGVSGVKDPSPKMPLSESELNKIRTATGSITVELIKANDVSDEGAGKVAELLKKYGDYAKILGKTNPLVREYAALIAYANEHNGHTPAEVAKVNRAIEEQIDELNKEIYAIQSVSDMYGAAATDQLAITKARIAAEKEYSDAVRDGGDEAVAAERKLLKLVSAQAQIDEAKKRSAQSTAIGFAGPALDAQESDLRAHYALVAKSADDRLAVERELQSKLNQLRSTALKKTENPYDGMKAGLLDYTESVGTASSRMASLWGSSFKSMEDALSNFVGNGEMDVESLFRTIRTEIARTQVVQPLLSGLSSGSLFSGLSGMFSGLFNANGNAFSPSGLMAFADGGVVSSPTAFRFGAGGANLGIMGEAGPEAIMPLKRGSDGKLGVAAGGQSSAPANIYFTVVNRTGQNVKMSASKVQQNDDGSMTATLLLDLVNRNVGGLRTGLQNSMGK